MIKDKLLTLPMKPGCYLMKDKDGKVIYVGKAIKLKNRVNSYFRGAHDYKTTKLVSNIRDFDYIVTKNEKEALILEYNLIKQYDPYFNIVFKDDKSYPYIYLSENNGPSLSVIRLKKNGKKLKGKLFGPYPDVTAARGTVELLNKLYPLKKCDKVRPELCLYYHIGECLGYCEKKIDKEIIDSYLNSLNKFLSGDISQILKELNIKMNEASERLDYESASKYRDLINNVKASTLKQDVQINRKECFDVFNYAVEDGYIAIVGLFIKDGKLINTHKYIDYLVGDSENFVSSYLYQFYMANLKPKNLFVNKEVLTYLNDSLEDTKILTVNRGKKYQLLKQAKENAEEYLRQNKEIITKKENYQYYIKEEFKKLFNKDIKRIELFDNSHTAGKQTVAAMVVYKDFKPLKNEYRLYKLEEGADDLKSMQEVIYRRYFKVLKDNLNRPDLIIVDGGEIQINAAKKILDSLKMDILLVGLGKDKHHNTAYLMNNKFERIEIDNTSNLFFFLASMQDEVHRFAITYHKKLRKKATYKSILDDIDGIGPKTRLKLLKKYKSLANLKEASLDELKEVLPDKVALRLYNKLMESKENA